MADFYQGRGIRLATSRIGPVAELFSIQLLREKPTVTDIVMFTAILDNSFGRESQLYKRVCPSVHWSVRWSVRWPVGQAGFFGRPKMLKIEPEAAKGVSEWRSGQRKDDAQLILCIQTGSCIYQKF